MKKQVIIGSFMALSGVATAQQWTTNSANTSIHTTDTTWNVGIKTTQPHYPLDVRGFSTFGSLGLTKNFMGWSPTGDQSGMILSGDSSSTYGFGSYYAVSASSPQSGNILGVFGFAQSRKGTSVTNAGIKASIIAYATGVGGSTNGLGGDMAFCTTGDNTGVVTAERMRITNKGYVGIGTNAPSEQLHTTSGVRFAGLTTGGSSLSYVGIDATGKLWITSGAGGISNACTTTNFVPKTSGASGNLTCSQIFDDGTSVGIGVTSGFAYTWSGGLTGTTAPPASGTVKLAVNGVARALAYFATSDERYKKEIHSIDNALGIINKLNGKTYLWKSDEITDKGFNAVKQYGFIAQELEKIVPEAVATDENGFKSVSYDMIIPILVQSIKEQQKQIEDLKAIATNPSGSELSAATGIDQLINPTSGFALDQNIPNPFSQETVIKYTLPQQANTAYMLVYDLTGKQIASYPLTEKGSSSITITSEKLAAGIYIYSVMADGKILDSKRMVVAQK